MADRLSIKSVLSSPAEKMEQTEEGLSKTMSSPLTRSSMASVVLTRLLMAKRSLIKRNNSQIETDHTQHEPSCAENPVLMEDYSTYINEYAEEVDRISLGINEDFIKNILTDHIKRVGIRSHLWEDLASDKIEEENIKAFLTNCKSREINALMLYASFMERIDLVRNLCKYGANIDYCEPEYELTALHLCAFRNCLDGVRYLISQGATINTKSRYTPLHYAAFGDAFDVAYYFIQQGISQESLESKETPLHIAVRTNALRVLSLLITYNKELDRLDEDGYAAIHHAADERNSRCLKIFIKTGCPINILTRSSDTVLHLATTAGCVENVALLVEANADIHLRNHRGHTALHLAARSHSLECVEILLNNGADPNVEDNDGRTPLHLSLGKSIVTDDITELLVSRKADVNKADKYGYTPLHIAASNELSQCVNILIKHEADLTAKTKGGTSALSIVLRKTPNSLDVFEKRLNLSMTLHRQQCSAGEIELRLNFRPLLQHHGQGELYYLDTFVKEGYKEILEHPLCQSFLHLKWQKIRKYYVARLLFYLVYVLILTSWVMIALAHNCYNESHGYKYNPSLCSNTTIYNFFHIHPKVLEIQWYVLAVFTIFEAFRKLTIIPSYLSIKQFFTQAENLVEWCVIFSIFAISFVYTGRTYAWQSYLGAFAVLSSWSNLMLMIGQLPVFGAYVAMFTSVQAQVFKLLLAYACLLIGFTASFCVIFPHTKSFSSPYTGIIKILAMMTGELNFDDLFYPNNRTEIERKVLSNMSESSWILLQVSAQLCFVLFLLFVTIVLMNLLIGIAVDDIKGLQKTAGLAKLVRQTKLICNVEIALLWGLLPRRLLKYLQWTTLVLPSPLRAAMTVRPLNPRENRLPRDVLSTAYKIAKDGEVHNFASIRKRSMGMAYYAKAFLKGSNAFRRRTYDENNSMQDCNKLKDDIDELRKICEKNHTLLQHLIKTCNVNKQDSQ